MKVIWLGQNGLLFISGKTKVLVDPYLSDSLRGQDSTKVRRWAVNKKFHTVEPNVIILTSSRPDHTDTETLRYYINGNRQLVTVLCCEGAFKKISSAGFTGKYNKVFMDNSSHWTHDNLYFQSVPAYTNESGAFGMIITDSYDGKKYYITSNTVYTDDILKYVPKDIDTLFVPISGETGGMDVEKAAYFAKRINAKHTVPLKFGMFDNIDPLSLDLDNLIAPFIYKIIPIENEDTALAAPISVTKAEEKTEDISKIETKSEQTEKVEKMENYKDTENIKDNKEEANASFDNKFDPFATDKFEGTVEIDTDRYAVAFATLDSIEEMSRGEKPVLTPPVTEIEDTDDEEDEILEIKVDNTSNDNPFDDPDFDFRQFVYDPNRNKENVKEEIPEETVEEPYEEIVEEVSEETEEAPKEIVEETMEETEEAPEEIVEEVAEETEEAEDAEEELDSEYDESDDEDDYDYDEEFYIKDSEYDEKYAIVQGEFYDEDENATEELDAIDGNVGDSDEEELYVEEAVSEFEQVSLFEEAVEEAVEEIAEENAEEVAEETTEEVAEETVEEVIEEAVEEVTEEATEEGTEETVEEPIEEIVEEIAEETAEEIVEESVEETFEEPVIEEEEEIEAEILYDEDGNEICTYDGVVMHYDSDADDEELFGFDVGDDYYDNEPEKDDEDVSHIIDAYVNVLEKLDNGEDVDFNSIVF